MPVYRRVDGSLHSDPQEFWDAMKQLGRQGIVLSMEQSNELKRLAGHRKPESAEPINCGPLSNSKQDAKEMDTATPS
jgi:hypothetical protein